MIKKPRIELTPEQIRERSDRAGLRPFVVEIIDFHTHVHAKYLVFADHPTIAINLARSHGHHASGSTGTATTADTAFIAHIIGQVGRLSCENVDAHCIVSIAEPDYVTTLLDTTAQPETVSGNSESKIADTGWMIAAANHHA